MKHQNWLISLKDEKDHQLIVKFKEWFTQQVTDFDGYFVFKKKYHGIKGTDAIATDISAGFEVITLDDWKEEIFDKEVQEISAQQK